MNARSAVLLWSALVLAASGCAPPSDELEEAVRSTIPDAELASACDPGVLLEDDFDYGMADLEANGWSEDASASACVVEDGDLVVSTDMNGPRHCRPMRPVCLDALDLSVEIVGAMRCSYACSIWLKFYADSESADIDKPLVQVGYNYTWDAYYDYVRVDAADLFVFDTEAHYSFELSSDYPPDRHLFGFDYDDGKVTFRIDDTTLVEQLPVASTGTRLQADVLAIDLNNQNPTYQAWLDSVYVVVEE